MNVVPQLASATKPPGIVIPLDRRSVGPATLAGRRLVLRYRVPLNIADAIAALAGLGDAR
jgi:hypothetical protein